MEPDTDNSNADDLSELRKMYSATVIEHASNPRNVGSIPGAEGHAVITGPCGDTMEIWLRIREDVIVDASFWTDGCGTTIASASMTTEMAKGKRFAEAGLIGQKEVLQALGGLPEDSEHCALLASNTLKAALRDYLAYKKEPWKRAYKRG